MSVKQLPFAINTIGHKLVALKWSEEMPKNYFLQLSKTVRLANGDRHLTSILGI